MIILREGFVRQRMVDVAVSRRCRVQFGGQAGREPQPPDSTRDNEGQTPLSASAKHWDWPMDILQGKMYATPWRSTLSQGNEAGVGLNSETAETGMSPSSAGLLLAATQKSGWILDM